MSGAAPRPRVPTDVLRAAVREAIGTRSLREAAAQIGISHTGLRGFLRGARPHDHTRRKLEGWLADVRGGRIREGGSEYAAPPGRETYRLGRATVRALAEAVDPDGVADAIERYDALVRRLFGAGGRTPPSWIGREKD